MPHTAAAERWPVADIRDINDVPEVFTLTEELKFSIFRYLEVRNELGEDEFWTMPMELTRRDIGVALLNALALPVAPKPSEIVVDEDNAASTSAARTRRRIPTIVVAKVWARDGFQCVNCGSKLFLTIDHKHPHSKGGSDDESNLQTLCGSCNSRKRDRVPDA